MVKNTIQNDALFCQSSNVVSAGLDQESVMMSIERGNYYGLDPVGTDIWDLLQEPRSFQDICEYLVNRYSVDNERCKKEVEEFLEQMLDEELVEKKIPQKPMTQ